MKDHDTASAFYYIIILVFLLSALFARGEFSKNIKMILGWVIILFFTTALVVYWDDFKQTKLYASLVPGHNVELGAGEMYFMRAADGHFHINAKVNGVDIKFMVDTGASSIVLNKEDAIRTGFNVEQLSYNMAISTANGQTRAASVNLQTLQIGGKLHANIAAIVNEGELDSSLLGMSFLDKIASMKIEGDKLTLKFN